MLRVLHVSSVTEQMEKPAEDSGFQRHVLDAHLLPSRLIIITATTAAAANQHQDEQQQDHPNEDEKEGKEGNVPVRLEELSGLESAENIVDLLLHLLLQTAPLHLCSGVTASSLPCFPGLLWTLGSPAPFPYYARKHALSVAQSDMFTAKCIITQYNILYISLFRNTSTAHCARDASNYYCKGSG